MGASNINIHFLIFTAFGTSTALTLPYEENRWPVISAEYREVSNLDFNNKAAQPSDDAFDSILNFSKKLILNSKDIDEEFLAVINNNFWGML